MRFNRLLIAMVLAIFGYSSAGWAQTSTPKVSDVKFDIEPTDYLVKESEGIVYRHSGWHTINAGNNMYRQYFSHWEDTKANPAWLDEHFNIGNHHVSLAAPYVDFSFGIIRKPSHLKSGEDWIHGIRLEFSTNKGETWKPVLHTTKEAEHSPVVDYYGTANPVVQLKSEWMFDNSQVLTWRLYFSDETLDYCQDDGRIWIRLITGRDMQGAGGSLRLKECQNSVDHLITYCFEASVDRKVDFHAANFDLRVMPNKTVELHHTPFTVSGDYQKYRFKADDGGREVTIQPGVEESKSLLTYFANFSELSSYREIYLKWYDNFEMPWNFLETDVKNIKVNTGFRQVHNFRQATLAAITRLEGEPKVWNKAVALTWEHDGNSTKKVYEQGKWMVWRKNMDDSNAQYEYIGAVNGFNITKYEDKSCAYDVNYKYKVAFCPDYCKYSEVQSTPDYFKNGAEVNVSTKRTVSMPTLRLTPTETSIEVKWESTGFPSMDAEGNRTTFQLQRKAEGAGGGWGPVGSPVEVTRDQEPVKGSYEDLDIQDISTTYVYRLELSALGTTFYSEEVSGRMAKGFKMFGMTATAGSFADVVKINWKVKHQGNVDDQFVVFRQLINVAGQMESEWMEIYRTTGMSDSYLYEDNTALPGNYYRYKVQGYQWEDRKYQERDFLTAVGFAQSTGVVSGRVFYGTGTAVEGVRINLSQSDDSDDIARKRQFSSIRFNGFGAHLTWPVHAERFTQLFDANKPFSVQMYVNVDPTTDKALLFAVGKFALVAEKDLNNNYALKYSVDGTTFNAFGNEAVIPAEEWVHLTLVQKNVGDGVFYSPSLYIRSLKKEVLVEGQESAPRVTDSGVFETLGHVEFGASSNERYKGYSLLGNIDDVRFWTKALTAEQDSANFDRIISGSEGGLKLYWPMDEGIDHVFDVSQTGGVSNNNHAVLTNNCISSAKIPSQNQLSLYGLTDASGNYIVRGIPFNGLGVNYSLTPTKGIHSFAPHHATRFVSASELNHSAVDFEDKSSFKVRGKVVYANTNYPVEDVGLFIDGDPAARDGKAVLTDANGEYEISVPIGDHYVSVAKQDHVFTYNGRYPADETDVGTRATFVEEIPNLNFYDETLSTFAGRIVGGDIEGKKVLGLGESVNNLGRVQLTLKAVADKYSLNIIQESAGDLAQGSRPNDKTLPVEATSTYINSSAYRGASELSNHIYITTDYKTGEFVAKVPPIEYKLMSVKVVASQEELLEPGVQQIIDATNVTVVNSDTVPAGLNKEKFEWHNAAYREPIAAKVPTFVVTQDGAEAGAYGERTFIYKELDQQNGGKVKETPISLYSVDNLGQVTYNYNNSAIFVCKNPYTFRIKGYQEFKNADTKDVSQVPLAGTVVTINNALSADQKVVVADAMENGVNYKAGQVYDLKSNQCVLDDKGEFTYKWKAGLPNITAPYTRTLSMSYMIGDQIHEWNGKPLVGVILGDLATGSNFVTAGPDRLTYILRDPSGSNSYATWKKGVTLSTTDHHGSNVVNETSTKTVTSFGFSSTFVQGSTAGGCLLGFLTEVSERQDLDAGITTYVEHDYAHERTLVTSTTKEFKTSEDDEYVGPDGDLYIGTGTNILFGKANQLSLYPTAGGSGFALDVQEVTSFGSTFSTNFAYSQKHVKTKLIPDLIKLRKEQLQTKASQAEVDGFVNYGEKTVYLTTLNPDDKDFGQPGTYRMVLPESYRNKPEGFCVNDTINWINLMIQNWEGYMAQNEEQKVKAFEARDRYLMENLSFDSGSSITHETSTETTNGTSHNWVAGATAMVGYGTDASFNKTVGITLDVESNTTMHYTGDTSSSETEIIANSFTLVENGIRDALTLDVLSAPDGFGPIFRNRGGRTSGPYEGEVRTEYYQPGRYVISEATMQIEVPTLDVVQPILSDVPSGRPANFELHLGNASETADVCTYRLYIIDDSNTKGAKITVDGQSISAGRMVRINSGEVMVKRLQIEQTNVSLRDYEDIAVVFGSTTDLEIADTVWLSAHFVPSSSDVTLALDKTTMNVISGDDFRCTIKDFDRTYENFKSLSLQYRYEADESWTELRKYVMSAPSEREELIPEKGNIEVVVPMDSYPDGKYTFRVVSAAAHGLTEVTVNSEEIVMTKDMSRPQLLGSANPADGILSVGDQINVRFNEDIRQGMLVKDANFIVCGKRNNAKIDHNVALRFNNSANPAVTELPINLNGKDFTVDMWVLVISEGNLLTHGTKLNGLTMDVMADGKLAVNIGGKQVVSKAPITKNRWIFLTLNYRNIGDEGLLNALCAVDGGETMLFQDELVPAYTGNGRLAMGANLNGAMHDVALWNHAREAHFSLSERELNKSVVTPGLIGYWKMNEGHGSHTADLAEARHLGLGSASWYLNNPNNALSLDGTKYLAINTGAISPRSNESYALEFWFCADDAQKNPSTLMQAGNGKVMLRTNDYGNLVLVVNGKDEYLSKVNPTKGAWHHCLLNVVRGGSAILYLDGSNVLTIPESFVPAIGGSELVFGAKRTYQDVKNYTCNEYFKGAIDEVRFWNGQYTGKYLNDKRYERVDTTFAAGLVAYYPMEKKQLDTGGQVQEIFSLDDASKNHKVNGTAKVYAGNVVLTALQALTSPALKTAPVLENLAFTYTSSEREIFIKMDEAANLLEGVTVNITLRDVLDINGNHSTPITWSAYIRQNALLWASDDLVLDAENGKGASFKATVSNKSGVAENWALSNMPSWLSADVAQGVLAPEATQEIHFTVNPAVSVGTHEEVIYLTGNNSISEGLNFRLNVRAEAPDWSVDPTAFSSVANLTGQVFIGDKICENSETRVAAFINGKCTGLSQLEYVASRDAYYLFMNIYGNEAEDGQPVAFKVWDASTGMIYSNVVINDQQVLNFGDNAQYGSVDQPTKMATSNEIEQVVNLNKGWNWVSFYVNAESNALQSLQASGNLLRVADQSSYAEPNGGNLKQLSGDHLYKVNMSAPTAISVVGTEAANKQAINPGFNWIGGAHMVNLPLLDAFTSVAHANDLVKNMYGFAIYNGNIWEGSLKVIEPGKGYIYKNASTQVGELIYPKSVSYGYGSQLKNYSYAPALEHFAGYTSIADEYSNNMTMVACVTRGEELIREAEVAVYVGAEFRTVAVTDAQGRLFLTIPGDQDGERLRFVVFANGQEYIITSASSVFSADAHYGALTAPVRLDLDSVTGIELGTQMGTSENVYFGLDGRAYGTERKDIKRTGVYILRNSQNQTKKVMLK